MAGWRLLELAQPDGPHVPQLLVKPVFGPASYTLLLTCLSNIWSEELDVDGIVARATAEQSPIEVSKHDAAQLAILLDNIQRSLHPAPGAVCSLTRSGNHGLRLHTTITLPGPLDSLTWTFRLEKRASTTLKNELILPLLVSSHMQHERVSALVSAITDKDKAITRLVDQYESSNLDLAAAFPIISGLKTGRGAIKREQAAKHIPALQPFREHAFQQETGYLPDSDLSTLALFQQALSGCTPKVPPQLQSDDADLEWWTDLSNTLRKTPSAKPVPPAIALDGEEAEDELETHANFNPVAQKGPAESEDDSTEDDDDLDASPQGPGQRSSQTKAATPVEPRPSVPVEQLVEKRNSRGFRIGGKAKPVARDSPPPTSPHAAPSTVDQPVKDQPPSHTNNQSEATPKKAKRTFKIGGKGKGGTGDGSHVPEMAPPMRDGTRAIQSPSAQPSSSLPKDRSVREESPALAVGREETAEEKAERRRAELKRKTEEAAKKQAQSKKKRRF
ncbi:XRCC4-like factor-domain-containing protein [Ampelomyces quisqualis]|uniref:Non-homologous end-joining factor 1 n=1 Tax=Ampelomyces quisqualis TaxID=50730 RepID=A0A6A5QPY4_AMPQU|nr:XRCC4-like factor-domain-containing protein [Ampelomyces quisqualis]